MCACLALLLGCASPTTWASAGPSLCAAGEKPVLVCQLGTKQAALCVFPVKAPFASMTYRYGRPGRIELEHAVRGGDPEPFGATVSPANPQAIVHQVWFNAGDTRYVMTACEGGQCAHRSGLIVLGPKGPISARACKVVHGEQPAFARDVVQFGSDLGDSRTSTDLLRFEDTDNRIERLYAPGPLR